MGKSEIEESKEQNASYRDITEQDGLIGDKTALHERSSMKLRNIESQLNLESLQSFP